MNGSPWGPTRRLKRNDRDEAGDLNPSKISRREATRHPSYEYSSISRPTWQLTSTGSTQAGKSSNKDEGNSDIFEQVTKSWNPHQSPDEFMNEAALWEVTSMENPVNIIVEDDSSVVICLGMVFGVQAAYVEGFSLDETCFNHILARGSLDCELKLRSKKSCYFLCQALSDASIAVVDKRTSSVLQTIEAISSAQLSVFKDESPIDHDDDQGNHLNSQQRTIHLVIDIYVPRKHAKVIGKELSKARFFLQQPYRLRPSILYENPHEFKSKKQKLGKYEDGSLHSLPDIQAPTIDLPKEARQASMVEQLLHTQVQSQEIQELEPDRRVTTELLPHQKQALYFILQRERGVAGGNLSLWKIEGTQDRRYYRHSIHSVRTATPEDNRGGILADEMGLGKTLSLISAIVASLEDSKVYSKLCEQRSNARSLHRCRATLVIAPSTVLLDGWLAEIKSHVRVGTLNVCMYHGQGRHSCSEKLLNYDVVLTTYATIATEYSRASSPLQNLEWFRIVLDEAHFIRNPSTKQFRAICNLTAQRRWCLSGTPVQNSLEDLGSLIQFLRVPYLDKKADFKKHIISPLLSGKPESTLSLRLLLDALCLRRMMSLLELPPTQYQTQRVTQSPEERMLYGEILQNSREEIDNAISSKMSGKAYSIILRAILWTRMLCDHGTLLGTASTSRLATPSSENDDTLATLQEGDGDQLSPLSDLSSSDDSQMEIDVPQLTSRDLIHPTSANTTPGHSTKLLALVKNLKNEGSCAKSIIFSCWRTTLDILEPLLRSNKISFIRIDGNVSGSMRASIVKRFHTDPMINTILMTTGTGAVGLNLSIATRVHILEPQWNPSIESQAIGRALRLTQKNPVTVIRYITENTIEEQIQDRQSKKLELAELTLNRDMGSQEQMSQRLYNLRSLLRA